LDVLKNVIIQGQALILVNKNKELGYKKLNAVQMYNQLITDGNTKSEAALIVKKILSIQATQRKTAATNADSIANAKNTVTLLAKAKALGAVALAWLATPVGAATAVIALVAGLAYGLNYLSKSQERAVQTAKDLADEYSNLKSEVSSLESELKSLADRIDELNRKDNLTFVERDELTQLKTSNDELERQLRIRERLAELKGKEAEEAAIKVIEQRSEQGRAIGHIGTLKAGRTIYEKIDRFEAVNREKDKLNTLILEEEALKKLQDAVKVGSKKWHEYQRQIDANVTAQAKSSKYIDETTLTLIEHGESLIGSSDKTRELKNDIYELVKANDDFFSKTPETRAWEAFWTQQTSKIKNDVENMAKEGVIDVSEFENAFPELSDAIEEAGLNIEKVVGHINASFNSIDTPEIEIHYTGDIKSIIEDIKQLQSSTKLIQDVSKEMDEFGKISNDTATKIMEAFPDNFHEFLNFDKDGIITANIELMKEQSRVKIEEDIKMLESSVARYEGEIRELEKKKEALDKPSNVGDYHALDEINTKIAEFNRLIDESNTKIEMKEAVLKNTREELDKLSGAYDDLSKATTSVLSDLNKMNDAFAEQQKFGEISIDTMYKVIDAGYALALSFDEATGAIYLNEEAFIDLAKAKIQDQIYSLQRIQIDLANEIIEEGRAALATANAINTENLAKDTAIDITDELAQATRELNRARLDGAVDPSSDNYRRFRQTELQIKSLQFALENISTVTKGQFTTALSGAAKAAKGLSDALKEQQKVLEEQKKAIQETINALNDQLNMYNAILRAVSGVWDKEIKALQESNKLLKERRDLLTSDLGSTRSAIDYIVNREVDLLREQLKLLDDVNKARQTELDIQQKLYALQQLRNQRTARIFVEGEGWTFQNNQDDIRKAQDDYNTALRNANLDEVRKSIDDQIAGWQNFLRQFDGFVKEYQFGLDLQKASALLGMNVEQAILTDRETFFNAWKDRYLKTQHEVERIDRVQAANDAKIAEFQRLKDQWTSITNMYRDEQDRLLAEQMFGVGWERKLLADRGSMWQKFANDYINIQRQIANETARMEAVNRQAQQLAQQIQQAASNAQANLARIQTANNQAAQAQVQAQQRFAVVNPNGNMLAGPFNTDKEAWDFIRSNAGKSNNFNGATVRAFADGTANSEGDWGAKESGKSLTGELGQEIVVRDNKWFTVGDHGAEFVDIKKGDIIFNHKQTEEILKHGRITGRGKAFADGNVDVSQKSAFDRLMSMGGLANLHGNANALGNMISGLTNNTPKYSPTTNNNSSSFSVNGGININNPVGDVNALAREINKSIERGAVQYVPS